MARQVGGREHPAELGARQPPKRIEFQPRPVGFDHGKRGTIAAVEALAAGDPAVECREFIGKRGCFADAAAGIAVAEAQIALGIAQGRCARRWRNGTHVGKLQTNDQRVTVHQRFFEQLLGIEKPAAPD